MLYILHVIGEPKPQPRGRATVRKINGAPAGARAAVYDPGTADYWKALVNTEGRVKIRQAITQPVRVDVDVFVPRPKALMRAKDPAGAIYCTNSKDIDNYLKGILDALKGVAWRDDGQVCDGRIRKLYHAKDGRPGARIVITPIHNLEVHL